ncbi:MAG: class I SAM-dependent methyltransferase [bacterium]
MPHERLYTDLADLWPLLSPPEHYVSEAAVLRKLLEERLPTAHSLLELGAGGGHTLCHLRDAYECVAVDLSEAMLANCRALNPGVEAIVGDMRDVRLDRTFDAVLIHDAIDYMLSADELRRTLDTAAAHLAPGGLAFIAPTYLCETFTNHETEHDQRTAGDRTLTYLGYVHDPDPGDTTFELILTYLINDAGELRIEHDRHTCGLFDEPAWQRLMEEAGFDVDRYHPADDEPDWPLFVGARTGGSAIHRSTV